MGTKSLHHLKLNISILITKTAASLYFWSNTTCVEDKSTAGCMTKEHPKKPQKTSPKSPTEISTENNYNLWDGKKL